MATTRRRAGPLQKLDRDLMEQLLFGTGRARRFTQDSPVLPDVWLEYAKQPPDDAGRRAGAAGQGSRRAPADPLPPVKLLLTPYREVAAGEVRRTVRERLPVERRTAAWRAFGHAPEPLPRVVYNLSTVAATLHFEDLVRVVLPMTEWWHRLTQDWTVDDIQDKASQRWLAQAIKDPEHQPIRPGAEKAGRRLRVRADLLWMIRVVGALTIVRRGGRLPRAFTTTEEGVAAATEADWLQLVVAVAELVRGVRSEPRAMVYSVSLNREAAPTVSRSTLAIKADAARRLFAISCRDLTWAVIDSGIDARHPAFRARDPKTDKAVSDQPFVDEKGDPANCTRVVETYDFTQIDAPARPGLRGAARGAEEAAARQLPGGQAAEAAAGGALRGPPARPRDRLGSRRALHPRPARGREVQAPRERSRHARGRDPGRRLAADGVGRAPRGRPDRRLPGSPPVRPARARRGRPGRRVRRHGRAPVRPLPELDERVRRRPRREPEPLDSARGLELRVRPHAGVRRVRASRLLGRGRGGGGRQPGPSAVHDGGGARRRGVPQHQHHRSGQRRPGHHRRRHAPLPAAHLRRQLLLEPRADRRRPRQAGPGRARARRSRRRCRRAPSASRTAPAWRRRT